MAGFPMAHRGNTAMSARSLAWTACLLVLPVVASSSYAHEANRFSQPKHGSIDLDYKNDRFRLGNKDYGYVRRRMHKKDRRNYGKLSDVWLCLACALGWSLWILNSFQQQDEQDPFSTQQSTLVRGHVLQVTLGQDPDGTGIPVYHAVVDYIVETGHEPIHIRKTFETEHFLEEGFLNVELLVLEDDPTIAILKQDWLLQKAQSQFLDEKENTKCLRNLMSAVAAALIGLSLWGAINATLRLRPSQQTYGWVSIGIGAFLLWPTSYFLIKVGAACVRSVGPLAERHGTIMRGSMVNAVNCGMLDPLSGDDQQQSPANKSALRSFIVSQQQSPLAASSGMLHASKEKSKKARSPLSVTNNTALSQQPVFDEQRIFSFQRAADLYSTTGAAKNEPSTTTKGDSPEYCIELSSKATSSVSDMSVPSGGRSSSNSSKTQQGPQMARKRTKDSDATDKA